MHYNVPGLTRKRINIGHHMFTPTNPLYRPGDQEDSKLPPKQPKRGSMMASPDIDERDIYTSDSNQDALDPTNKLEEERRSSSDTDN